MRWLSGACHNAQHYISGVPEAGGKIVAWRFSGGALGSLVAVSARRLRFWLVIALPIVDDLILAISGNRSRSLTISARSGESSLIG